MREFVYIQKNVQQIRAFTKTLPLDGTYKIVFKKNDADRSSKQNRLSHKWYAERSVDTGLAPDEEKCYCKLMYGCPILIEEDEDFASFFDVAIRRLPYDEMMKAMKYVPVTSIMSVKQMTRYMHEVDLASSEIGIPLSRPEDLYYAAMGYKRKKS